MYDLQPLQGKYYATEEDIDSVLFSDNLQGVEIMFRDSILNAARIEDHEAYYHLSLKKAALPFYQLLSEGYSAENSIEAMQVYGNIGELLKKHLKKGTDQSSPETAQLLRGQSSELVVYGLMARDFSDSSSRYAPIPTRAIDDKAGIAGTDFILKPLYDPYLPEEWVQVKTYPTGETVYHPYVTVVGLNQLDPEYFGQQWHEDALAQCMLRELNGEASTEDINKIDTATLTFYQILDEQEEQRKAGNYTTPQIQPSLKGVWQQPGYRRSTESDNFDQ